LSEHPAIAVDGLSVHYRAPLERKATLKATLTRRGDSLPPRRIEAVRDVSFSVPHGGVLGVIGANGAGKTTLLRALAGILPPAGGRITIRGRVTALLALGVGFQPELSGRENAMLGGLASGLAPAAARRCVEDIMDFADLGEFAAYPMKTYSSGMQARLAFSVAVHVDPDVLLIDEALSTGDAAFRIKANRKMEELCARARAIVVVSHGLDVIRKMSTSVLWLDRGVARRLGEPDDVVAAYAAHATGNSAVPP
jgi:ABC-type polysaccharide/polyol phosphate transport system ATPase subunit